MPKQNKVEQKTKIRVMNVMVSNYWVTESCSPVRRTRESKSGEK